MTDFGLSSAGRLSNELRSLNIHSFGEACDFVAKLPYGRNADRADTLLILKESKGTCSSKHAFLAELALEQGRKEVELICCIFLMSAGTHPKLASLFLEHGLSAIPEAHCFLRINGERFDFTSPGNPVADFGHTIVREQRIDPSQVADWKPMIHKHYIDGWLRRNPQISYSAEELWTIREKMIAFCS